MATPLPAPVSLVIHGHFYQPPRENPFFDEVETEPSAAPYHDWNQRIDRECYRAVVAARMPNGEGRIERIVNALEQISFNFGPTLLEWMAREARDTYEHVLAADAASALRLGHGNAIAQPYHHAILPLATRRDKVTEVRWGIADFRARFRREPQGMWLPETAVDDETLDVLAQEGIRFTILGSHQVVTVPPDGLPGLYHTRNGRTIALSIYDGGLAHGVAFGGLLRDARVWADRIESLGRTPRTATRIGSHEAPRLVSLATDGETFGHHHMFGEMALARMLEIVAQRGITPENFASFLAKHPAAHPVTLVEPSAWSCAHGVERWRSNCSCRVNGERNPSQEWRTPLRDGLNALAESLHTVFETEGATLFQDPWAARDAYGSVVSSGEEALADFARLWATRVTDETSRVRARELLEMERDSLRMFTSCGWFFDDIGGIEPRQILKYAARAVMLAGGDTGSRVEAALLATLGKARSNDPALGTGREVYLATTRPMLGASERIAAAAVAAHHTGFTLPEPWCGTTSVDASGERVSVRECRTGRHRVFRAAQVRRSASDVVVDVAEVIADGELGAVKRVSLAEFPERARLALRSVLRRQLLPRTLTSDELDRLATGDVQLRGLVAVALTREIGRLANADGEHAIGTIGDLLDLLEQAEAKVPFDAQTVFWNVWQNAPPEKRFRLAPLRWRLGFSSSALESDQARG